MSDRDDETLGKAYDARLMRRLLRYLRPHRQAVVVALAAIIGHSLLQLAQPYLTKLVIDRHILTGDLVGLDQIALLFFVILVASFVLEYLETYTMQMMGQRIMFDLRSEIYGHLQRLDVGFYDRNPVGRLMTRVTTDVDALNDLFASGVISVFRDIVTLAGIMAHPAVDGLAARPGRFLRAAFDRAGDSLVPQERPRIVPKGAGVDRADQRLPAREHHRHVHRAVVSPGRPELCQVRRHQPAASDR